VTENGNGVFSFISFDDPVTQVILSAFVLFVAYRVFKLVRKPKITDDQHKRKKDLNKFLGKLKKKEEL
jgi:hypothetical protein